MKVLFVDVDGCLNTEQFQIERFKKFGKIECQDYYFQPSCMKHLKRIIDETKCKVVISSTWRSHPERMGAIKTNFVIHNINPNVIIGTTPNFVYSSIFDEKPPERGDEIKAWCKANDGINCNIESIAIIDDDSDMGDLKHRLIQTTWKSGLTRKLANKAIKMLNGE